MPVKEEKQDIRLDIGKEMSDAAARILEFEKSIQTGEADEDDISVARRKQIREQSRQLLKHRSDVQFVVGRAEGRRVMFRILEIAGPNRLSPNISDPYLTAESNGMRRIANAILEMLYDADPNVYAQMIREHVSDMKAEIERKAKEAAS